MPVAEPPSRARFGGFALAWALSVLPLLAGTELGRSLGACPRLVLAALPWIAAIGLPETGAGREGPRAWLLALGLAAPPLCLAGRLDLAGGLGPEVVLGIAGFVLTILVLLGEASHQARSGAARLHGLAWLALVPGAAGLAAALSWAVDGRAATTGLAGALASISPLASLWRDFTAGAVPLAAALFRPASAASAGLLLLTWLAARRERGVR